MPGYRIPKKGEKKDCRITEGPYKGQWNWLSCPKGPGGDRSKPKAAKAPCPAGKFRNTTGRCKNLPKSKQPCPPGKSRSIYNRCKKDAPTGPGYTTQAAAMAAAKKRSKK